MPKEAPKILIVEDEEDIQRLLFFHLIKQNYHVSSADTGEEALKKIGEEEFDLILLDIMLPGVDGIEVCKRIRQNEKTRHLPILMLTAKTEEEDIVFGLDSGADDYITKPFSPKVLIARIKALLRRSKQKEDGSQEQIISLGNGLEIDLDAHEVRINGKEVDLTVSEFDILSLLCSRPERVFSRDQIIEGIRGQGFEITRRAVDVLIHGLRKKLGDAGHLIETVRGVGYKIKRPTE